jgi:hypothetical protein
MNTKVRIVAVAAILTTLAIPGIASAKAISSSYDWNQMETINVPADARFDASVGPRHREPHAPRPYGQW